MKAAEVIVTTSWDDGHKLDVRLSQLLTKYHIKGTFYVSPKDHEFAPADRLTDTQIRTIGQSFEVGAHTMTHPRLDQVPDDQARQEIVDSKRYLERVIKKTVTSFCYPGGNYQGKHVVMVREAGFTYARTVRRHAYNLKGSLLEGNTTVNAYNHYQDLWKIAKFARFNPFKTRYYFQWDNLAKAMFDKVQAEGGVFHLWGHSWEINDHQHWEKLEEVLRYIADRQGASYVTNGELPDKQPKKLLIAAPYFVPHLGGVELYVYNIAKLLQQSHGWEVVIATSGDRGWRLAKTTYDGLTVYRLAYWLKLSNSPLNPWWPFWLNQIMKREDIYVINVHAPVPGLPDMAAAVARFRHLPQVNTYHNISMIEGKSAFSRLLTLYESKFLPLMLQPATAIVCSSDKVRDDFLQAYRSKSTTITPAVDMEAFRPAAKRPPATLLYVGSMNTSDTHKGVTYLLQAMQAVHEALPTAKLVLVGPGNGLAAFRRQAQKYGIADQVSLTGGKFGKELQQAFRAATVFVLPTLNESFGLVLLEAMASGLPIVSTKVGVIPRIVDDGRTGYVVPPADSQALAEKLTYLLSHPTVAQRFGKSGRQKVEQGLSWQAQADKMDAVLLKALQSTGPK